jgi:intein/homing endonuclease
VTQHYAEEARRKIIGETWIEIDKVVKVTETKNTIKSVIHRTKVRAISLECGHSIEVTRFQKVPTSNTLCHECDRPRREREITERLVRLDQ